MSIRVDSAKIEGIVGTERREVEHYARAVSAEQWVYILHSQECLDKELAGVRDLRDCPHSLALDNGIDLEDWADAQDRPVRVVVAVNRLVPVGMYRAVNASET